MPSAAERIRIRFTPAHLAPHTEQDAEIAWLADPLSRDRSGRLSAGTVAELASTGWFRQDGQRRGGYLSTIGLEAELDHPELVIENVPGALVEATSEILRQLAEYLIENKASFLPGEIYGAEGSETLLTFAAPVEAAIDISGTKAALVVIPLP